MDIDLTKHPECEYLPFVHKICNIIFKKWNKTLPGGLEFQDLTQIGYLVLLNCKKTFNQDKGKFTAYLARSIKNELSLYISSHLSIVHIPDNLIKSRQFKSKRIDMREIKYKDKEFLDVEDITRKLSDRQRNIVYLHFYEDLSLAEIGRRFDKPVSRELVRQILKSALEMMRKHCE